MQWFKFYGQDWMTDPKIAGLSMEDRLCLVTLLCIASGTGKNDGVIKGITEETLISMSQIPSWPTREYNPSQEAIGVLGRLEALRIVTFGGNGEVTLRNYVTRQGGNKSNAEKQKRYRERLKQRMESTGNVTVTSSNSVVTKLPRIDKNRIIPADADFLPVKEVKIDSEGREKPPSRKDPLIPLYEELLVWAESRRGFTFTNRVKQYAALKKARLAGISITRLKKRWQECEEETWRDGFDWTSVISSYDKKA